MNDYYDGDLYQALLDVSTHFDESIWLGDHIRINHEEKELFLNNEIENPHFRYRKQQPVLDYANKLEIMYGLLKSSKAPAIVIDLYLRKIEKQLLRNVLITASISGDDQVFSVASKELYGKPKKKYFSYVAKRVLDLCDSVKNNNHHNSVRRLRTVMNRINTKVLDIEVNVLPPVVKADKIIESIDEVKDIFLNTLKNCGIKGWELQVDNRHERNRFSVKPSEKIIFIPSEKQLLSRPLPLTYLHVQALAEHEIGVHVRRTYEASLGKLKLLEIGLDNYLIGEEGLAGYVQQQIEGAVEFYGFDRYLAASLASGMDGKERDFRSVFGLMKDYYTLKFVNEKTEFELAATRSAWDVCVRIFRGSSGQTAGAIYTKDIVYMEGNIEIWNLLSEKPHVFESLFVGKFNPMLSRHVRTLQTLDILSHW